MSSSGRAKQQLGTASAGAKGVAENNKVLTIVTQLPCEERRILVDTRHESTILASAVSAACWHVRAASRPLQETLTYEASDVPEGEHSTLERATPVRCPSSPPFLLHAMSLRRGDVRAECQWTRQPHEYSCPCHNSPLRECELLFFIVIPENETTSNALQSLQP